MKTSELRISDYNEFYQPYISALGEVNLLTMMQRQLKNFPEFIESIPSDRWTYAYAPGKWTIAEVLLHVIDTERIFQYRALRIGRRDATPLPGFDQNAYVPYSGAHDRSKESIIEEYQAVRGSSISLFKTYNKEALLQKGMVSGYPVTAGALGFIICGHQRHHRNGIREHYLLIQS